MLLIGPVAFCLREFIAAEIIIATKSSCNKKCITNEKNKAVEKKRKIHTNLQLFFGVLLRLKYSISSVFLYYICILFRFLWLKPLYFICAYYLFSPFSLFFSPQSTGNHMSYGPWLNISCSVSARQSWLVGQSWVAYFSVANLSWLLSKTSHRSSAVHCCLMSVRIFHQEQRSPIELEIAFRYSTGIYVLLKGHRQPQVFAGVQHIGAICCVNFRSQCYSQFSLKTIK